MPVETEDGGEDGGREVGGEGEFSLAGEERVEAEDLPAGGGDIVNNGDGNGVEGKVNGVEIIDEAVECRGILIREDGAAGAGGFGVMFDGHVRSFPGLESG